MLVFTVQGKSADFFEGVVVLDDFEVVGVFFICEEGVVTEVGVFVEGACRVVVVECDVSSWFYFDFSFDLGVFAEGFGGGEGFGALA